MYELELAPGTKVGKVSNLSDDIAIALKAPGIRVVAPIQGKSTIGIEVPNTHRKPVQIRELYETAINDIHKHTIPLLLGKDIAGYPLISDLCRYAAFISCRDDWFRKVGMLEFYNPKYTSFPKTG